MRNSEKSLMIETIGKFVAEQIHKATEPLKTRITELENAPRTKGDVDPRRAQQLFDKVR